jgi:hypothetical protein
MQTQARAGGVSERCLGAVAALAVATALLQAPCARAHGGLAMDQDKCKLTVGPYLMHFAGYQEDAQRSEFCEDIPHRGKVIVVLDFVDDGLRDMPVEVRVVRQNGGPPEQAPVVFQIPPKVYPSGTMTFSHEFTEDGDYVGLVNAGPGRRYASVFPFSVGVDRSTPKLAAGGALLLGLGVGAFFFARQRLRRDVKDAQVEAST